MIGNDNNNDDNIGVGNYDRYSGDDDDCRLV